MSKMTCVYCGHIWQSRVKHPVECPFCKRVIAVKTKGGTDYKVLAITTRKTVCLDCGLVVYSEQEGCPDCHSARIKTLGNAVYTPDGVEYSAQHHRKLKERFHKWGVDGGMVTGRLFSLTPEDMAYFRRFYPFGYHTMREGMKRGRVVIK